MHRIVFSCTIMTLFCLRLAAQDFPAPAKFIQTAASPKGNYIFLLSSNDLKGPDSVLANTTASFTIERMEYAEGNRLQNTKKTMQATGVSKASDLDMYFTQAEIEELLKLFGLKTNAELATYFSQHRQMSSYPMLYDKIELRQALGHVYLDANVDSGKVYNYKVTRNDIKGNNVDYGFSNAHAKTGNYLLQYFKPLITNVYTTDSAAVVTWQMPVDVNQIFNSTAPTSPIAEDKASIIYRMPFSPLSTKAIIYADENGFFKKLGTIAPALNETNDTITYTYSRAMLPEQQLTVYLQTEDMVYNPGINSDTAVAFTVDKANMPLIQAIEVRDTINAVAITWDTFSRKPYITGIEIKRYNSKDELDSLATLPVTETMYMDYKVELGQTYRYQVKLKYDPWLKYEQEIPAQGTGAFTKFGRPLPVSNLTATNVNGMPMLSWTTTGDPSYFGGYIYRGTTPDDLDLIAGPIQANQFTDSATHLTARNPYYYAVMAQNLRQDTSVLSDVVSIVPDKKIETAAPSTIDFYYFNDTLRVSWNDIRANDNAVDKYLVMRSKGNEAYTIVADGITANNYINDIGILNDEPYNYKVAAITVRGDTSEFSSAYTYTLAALPIAQVDLFTVRSTGDGVELSLPSVEYEDRKAYNIYRREATQTEFTKLATLPQGSFIYTDKTAKNNIIYVYGISVVNLKNQEGARGKSLSIRYEK